MNYQSFIFCAQVSVWAEDWHVWQESYSEPW